MTEPNLPERNTRTEKDDRNEETVKDLKITRFPRTTNGSKTAARLQQAGWGGVFLGWFEGQIS